MSVRVAGCHWPYVSCCRGTQAGRLHRLMASSGLEQARLHHRHESSCFRTPVLPVSAGRPWSLAPELHEGGRSPLQMTACSVAVPAAADSLLPSQQSAELDLTRSTTSSPVLLSPVLSAFLPPSPSSSQSFTDTLSDYCVDILFDNMHINTDSCVDILLSLVYC